MSSYALSDKLKYFITLQTYIASADDSHRERMVRIRACADRMTRVLAGDATAIAGAVKFGLRALMA